jgi:putative oxidoreductase
MKKFTPMDLIRIMVAVVFLVEGVLKFLHSGELGAGRFARIGIPWPGVMGPVVGLVETVGGLLLLANRLTSWAALVLLINISVAILTTKVPILLGRPFGPFTLPQLPRYGVLSCLHEARTDLCMWLGNVALIWHHGLRRPGAR